MKTKLLFVCALVAMASSAYALDILPTFGSTKWNCSYDQETKTVTFDEAWAGCGWWVGGADYSDYAALDLTIEPSSLDLYLVVNYDENGEDSEQQSFAAGATELSITLDAEKSTHVYSMFISCGELTENPIMTMISAVLSPKAASESVTIFEGSFDLGAWDQQLDLPIARFATAEKDSEICITFNLNEGAEYGAISLNWIDGEWNWIPMSSLSTVSGYEPGGYIVVTSSGELSITLDADDAQNLINGEGHGVVVKGANLTITKIELVSSTASIATVDMINDVATEYFDIQGRRIDNPKEGNIYIVRRGGTVIKQLVP